MLVTRERNAIYNIVYVKSSRNAYKQYYYKIVIDLRFYEEST